jgi:hypothetical protein
VVSPFAHRRRRVHFLRLLLRRIARAYGPSSAKDEWRGRWRPIAAPWREDLLAVRERESAGVDALLSE